MTSKDIKLVVGALNIVASPHPEGVYLRALQIAAGFQVEVWGSDYAKITPPVPIPTDPENVWGLVHVWTEINRKGRWFDKLKDKEAEQSEKDKIVIPDHLDPNYRTFYYALDLKKHRLIIEYRNSEGENFGPSRAKRLFDRLLSPEVLGEDFGSRINVTVLPEENTVERILSLPKLTKLEIHIERPNADSLDDRAILAELEEQGARSQHLTLTKAPDVESLNPNEETRRLAEVASHNGYTAGSGQDAAGEPVYVSTRQHPKRVNVDVPEDSHPIVRFLGSLGLF